MITIPQKLLFTLFIPGLLLSANACQKTHKLADKPYNQPYFSYQIPENWSYFDRDSFEKAPEVYKEQLSAGDLNFISIADTSLGWFYSSEQIFFEPFSEYKKQFKNQYSQLKKQYLDFHSTDQFEEIELGQQKIDAIKAVSRFTGTKNIFDNEGNSSAIITVPAQITTIKINWPPQAVTTFICEEELSQNGLCKTIFDSIKIATPDLSSWKEPLYKEQKYSITGPQDWFMVTQDKLSNAYNELPPAVRTLIKAEESVSFIHPQTEYAIYANSIKLSANLDDQDALIDLGQNLAGNAAQYSMTDPLFAGLSYVNEVPLLLIDNLSFNKGNPQIKTRMGYLLNNDYAVGVTCTFSDTNRKNGEAYCQQAINSVKFDLPPIILKERSINTGHYKVTVPHGWYAIKGDISDDDLGRYPEAVSNKFEKGAATKLLLVNKEFLDKSNVHQVNIVHIGQKLDFQSEMMEQIQQQMASSFSSMYDDVNHLSGGIRMVGDKLIYQSHWRYMLKNGLSIDSTQMFVPCGEGAVIATFTNDSSLQPLVNDYVDKISQTIICQ